MKSKTFFSCIFPKYIYFKKHVAKILSLNSENWMSYVTFVGADSIADKDSGTLSRYGIFHNIWNIRLYSLVKCLWCRIFFSYSTVYWPLVRNSALENVVVVHLFFILLLQHMLLHSKWLILEILMGSNVLKTAKNGS